MHHHGHNEQHHTFPGKELSEQNLRLYKKADTLFAQQKDFVNIDYIEKMADKDKYTVFHLNNNRITKVPSLQKCSKLVTLNLSCNHIESLSFLNGMNSLKHLFLDNNKIHDITEFKNIQGQQFTDLTVFSNPCTTHDFDPVKFQKDYDLFVLCFNGVYAKKEDVQKKMAELKVLKAEKNPKK